MIVNESHSTMLTSPARTITGKVELYKGSTLSNSFNSNGALSKFTINRAGDTKFFGFGICQELETQLIDNRRAITVNKGEILKPYFGIENGSSISPTPLFYIHDVVRDENTNGLTIKAGDIIYKSRNITLEELDIVPPYSIYELAATIASYFGLQLRTINVTDNSFGTYYAKGGNFNGTESLRYVLDSIAEATQTIYYADANALVFKRLDISGDAVKRITKAEYFTLKSSTDVTLSKIVRATELGDNLSVGDGTAGYTQYVRNNPFWEDRDDISTLLSNALTAVNGLTLNQFNCEWRGNYLIELGDKIEFVTKDGDIVTSYLLDDKITYNGGLAATTFWEYISNENETADNPISIGEAIKQTYAKVDKIEKNITLYVGDIIEEVLPTKIDESVSGLVTDIEGLKATQTTITKDVAQLTLTTDSINQRVTEEERKTTVIENELGEVQATLTEHDSSIGDLTVGSSSIIASVEKIKESTATSVGALGEEINTLSQKVAATMTSEQVEIKITETLQNGVDSVTTSTGFTFNDEGLHISKSTSDMESLLDETGLTVSRRGTEMLKATSDGVKARNLNAEEYLKIENIRFEKYGNNRMGCFWIGG